MIATARWLVELWLRRYWKPGPAAAKFEGQTPYVVITGASEGIGRALATRFAEDGHALLLVARSAAPLEVAAGELRGRFKSKVEICPVDLATAAGCARVEAQLVELGGFADILVNNAGIGLSGQFYGQSREDIARLCDLNMRSLTDLMRRFLPGMCVRGRGGILNVASFGGLIPGPHQAVYYASKAYVISLTEAVRFEARGEGVRIAVLLPGPVATKFHAKMGADASYYRLLGAHSAETIARSGYAGFMWGRTLIVPGFLLPFGWLGAKVIPHVLLLPLIGWLLKRRESD